MDDDFSIDDVWTSPDDYDTNINGPSNEGQFTVQTPISIFFDYIAGMKQRQWIVKDHLLRGYVSCTFAPGGVGKSMFNLVQGISIASGRDLLGLGVNEQCDVLIINNEDDIEELQRRIAGTLISYNVDPSEIEDRLYYFSGYGSPLMVAQKLDDRSIMATPDVAWLKDFIKEMHIGALYVDPFISTHNLGENDNADIDKVVGTFKSIAHETRCAISLTHHTRKLGGNDSELHAGDADIGRGATSLKDAARCVDTLSRMSNQSAKKIDMDSSERVRHIRLDNGKSNFGLPEDSALWFRMESVKIPNGDYVGVPKPVNLSPMFEKAQSKDGRVKWTPTLVAEAVHRVMKSDDMALTEILYQFKAENNISNTQAREIIHMIGKDEPHSTMIRDNGIYYRYHYTKKNRTAPIIIHRREQ